MGRAKVYTDDELRQRKREAQKRYYRSNKAAYEKNAMKYWAKRLAKAGYTVIPPGGDKA